MSAVLQDLDEFLHAPRVTVLVKRSRLSCFRDRRSLLVMREEVIDLRREIIGIVVGDDLGIDVKQVLQVRFPICQQQGAHASCFIEAHVDCIVLRNVTMAI